jgi:hypothetical protein
MLHKMRLRQLRLGSGYSLDALAHKGEALCRAIVAIDYPNFKSSVNDAELSDIYNEIWALGVGYQR